MLKKLILIAGPTGSGKSKLAIHLAKKLNGEIINADSMQIYKEFLILSSRPSINDEKKWAATIPYGDRMYRELVKVGKGDFVILNAKLLEIDEGELGQPEYKFASNLANDKNLPDNFKSENETFIAFVNYLVEAKR